MSYSGSFAGSLSHTLVFSIKAHQKQKAVVAPCAIDVKNEFRIPYVSFEVDTILIMQIVGYKKISTMP